VDRERGPVVFGQHENQAGDGCADSADRPQHANDAALQTLIADSRDVATALIERACAAVRP
jgi:hypothetical protein